MYIHTNVTLYAVLCYTVGTMSQKCFHGVGAPLEHVAVDLIRSILIPNSYLTIRSLTHVRTHACTASVTTTHHYHRKIGTLLSSITIINRIVNFVSHDSCLSLLQCCIGRDARMYAMSLVLHLRCLGLCWLDEKTRLPTSQSEGDDGWEKREW